MYVRLCANLRQDDPFQLFVLLHQRGEHAFQSGAWWARRRICMCELNRVVCCSRLRCERTKRDATGALFGEHRRLKSTDSSVPNTTSLTGAAASGRGERARARAPEREAARSPRSGGAGAAGMRAHRSKRSAAGLGTSSGPITVSATVLFEGAIPKKCRTLRRRPPPRRPRGRLPPPAPQPRRRCCGRPAPDSLLSPPPRRPMSTRCPLSRPRSRRRSKQRFQPPQRLALAASRRFRPAESSSERSSTEFADRKIALEELSEKVARSGAFADDTSATRTPASAPVRIASVDCNQTASGTYLRHNGLDLARDHVVAALHLPAHVRQRLLRIDDVQHAGRVDAIRHFEVRERQVDEQLRAEAALVFLLEAVHARLRVRVLRRYELQYNGHSRARVSALVAVVEHHLLVSQRDRVHTPSAVDAAARRGNTKSSDAGHYTHAEAAAGSHCRLAPEDLPLRRFSLSDLGHKRGTHPLARYIHATRRSESHNCQQLHAYTTPLATTHSKRATHAWVLIVAGICFRHSVDGSSDTNGPRITARCQPTECIRTPHSKDNTAATAHANAETQRGLRTIPVYHRGPEWHWSAWDAAAVRRRTWHDADAHLRRGSAPFGASEREQRRHEQRLRLRQHVATFQVFENIGVMVTKLHFALLGSINARIYESPTTHGRRRERAMRLHGESDVEMLVECVAVAKTALEEFVQTVGRAGSASDDNGSEQHARLQEVVGDLQCRVLECAATCIVFAATEGVAIMEAGVQLYNASRAAMKAIAAYELAGEGVQSSDRRPSEQQPTALEARYCVVVARFWACKIMAVALSCSRNGGAREEHGTSREQFANECIDVLRSFGRVGALLLNSARADLERCQCYFRFADDAFACCQKIWSQIGLSYLTKLKHDMELDEILEDLWDFNMDRIRVLQFVRQDDNGDFRAGSAQGANGIVEALGELQMLVPYMPAYRVQLLKLVMETSDIYKKAGRHQEQVLLAEEALRLCDSMDSSMDEGEDEALAQLKQRLLVNVLESFGALKDLQRAETCFALLPQSRDPTALFVMIKILVDAQLFDKAKGYFATLFELDNLDLAIRGARMFAQAQAFSDTALKVYEDLERNFGEDRIEINLDLACSIALSDIPERRKLSIAELKRISSQVHAAEKYVLIVSPSWASHRSDASQSHSKNIERIHRTIFDATQHDLNRHAYEECIEWAELGVAVSLSERETGLYKRYAGCSVLHPALILSLCNLQVGERESAVEWARQAAIADPSKNSLFTLFQAELGMLSSKDSITDIIGQLKARDDFEIADLVAFAKVARDAGASKHAAVLDILDGICSTVCEGANIPSDFPIGILLQHTAQLAQQRISKGDTSTLPECSNADGRLVEIVDKYARMLLHASKSTSAAALGPSSVVEWFYAFFNTARSTERSELFVLGAQIAEMSGNVFGQDNALQERQSQCLLAAIASSMSKLESLDKDCLSNLLQLVNQCEGCLEKDDQGIEDALEYLVRSIELQGSRGRSVQARVSIQGDSPTAGELCYLFRRLISLAEAKANVLEWLEQFCQLSSSLDIQMSEEDVEWLVAKAWNTVRRRDSLSSSSRSRRSTKVHGCGDEHPRCDRSLSRCIAVDRALTNAFFLSDSVTAISQPVAERLKSDLHNQYQHFLALAATTHRSGGQGAVLSEKRKSSRPYSRPLHSSRDASQASNTACPPSGPIPSVCTFVAPMYDRSVGSAPVSSFFSTFDAHFRSAYSQICDTEDAHNMQLSQQVEPLPNMHSPMQRTSLISRHESPAETTASCANSSDESCFAYLRVAASTGLSDSVDTHVRTHLIVEAASAPSKDRLACSFIRQ
ncbi:hypothetical protein PybrP1_011727, partial [[Pythium] brassicae (nom. inval.)]